MRKYNLLITLLFLLVSSTAALAQESTFKKEARTHYDLGNIFYQQGRFEEAQREYQKAMDLLKNIASTKPEVPSGEKALKGPAKTKPNVSAVGKEKVNPAVTEYTVSEEDVLKISVWQNPDLDQEVIVRPDGKISFPLIGDVLTKGMTITELDQEITSKLGEFVRSPEVSISLTKIGGSKIIVLGEVMKPGIVAVTGAKTVLEAIGLAGGFTRDAVPSSVILIRGGFAQPQPKRLNLSKVLAGREFLQNNLVLQAEDILFVPKKFISDLNYFLSQILDPVSKGAYTSRELKSY
jgi:polysaccharide export outer membrane protein